MKKPKYHLFAALSSVSLVLGILMTTVGGHFSTVLTVAMEGSTTNQEAAVDTYAAGLEMNKELEREGIVLLKNENQSLPLSKGKVNVFGEHASNMIYNGSGSAAGSAEGAVTIKEGLEAAGLEVNESLWSYIEENSKSATDTSVHEGNEVDISNYPINEMSVDNYTGEYSFENLKSYSDTAIVVIGRVGGEGQDLPRTGYGEDGSASYLELSQNEKNLLKGLKDNGFHTIVLVNTSYAMELGFLDSQEYGVEAALWVGGPGIAGATSIGDVLTGIITPSGRLVDTYAYDLTTQSTYYTSDYNYYYSTENPDKILAGFSNYSENIYVGYRWYETADAEGYWNDVSNEYGQGYEGVVQYPFGYGLSYTSFTQEIESVDVKNEIVNFTVKVTNNGDKYSGKDVIQIYTEAPYTDGGIEKSKVVLSAFEKTKELAPKESDTYTLTVDLEDIASYDKNAANGSGAYILEQGDYNFYLSNNAHSWAETDLTDMKKTYVYHQEEDIVYVGDAKRTSDQTVAENQFKNSENDIIELSRADSFANAGEAVFSEIPDIGISKEDEIYNLVVTQASAAGEFQDEIGNIETGTDKKYTMSDMAGVPYDDEKWDKFISQMSIDDMKTLIGTGGWSTAAIESIGKDKTKDIDGPFGLSNFVQNELGNSENSCVSYCSEVVTASTWNKELVKKFGEMVGNEGNATGVSGWYAPGANLHRSSFSGRNSEYYSEDSYLSGTMCANMVEGALSKGLYVYVKHFAFNDQEANRTNKENCWMSEQTAREIYLKPFEMAVKDGGATGLMASYMWFDGQWCGGNYNLMTNVVRNEWGFHGAVITDAMDPLADFYMDLNRGIRTGLTQGLSMTGGDGLIKDTDDANTVIALRNAAHDNLYAAANSNAMNNDIGLATWAKIFIGADVVIALLLVMGEVLVIRNYKRRKTDM